ncbi:hypothetical protein A2767_01900 [Candidatus Roizmanbacteria bacterium RIFCSPHIGHO2_01_FULL_35_10]|uniref:tRNA/rRNA methyltransferase SpoU type domain-containing protein n=1 Tax=Candidatus Roizmanbacteria bacterium RIFCSPLOWO2_01_FULL_35_13 TaxID=1802055 RepID=A0A1F7I7F0_9BACT|nr:MAG: hypothetical protein A2767_01900 [Candidatus Roizmanbacteria bacterium RIFCSPHIGHO2_01_FULL_35_10]OGK39286.1 MAG: hypothetical protein A3A74_00435 [Candidatus Roizmanbacteria bacterium RIFCSPLOWO2_01_FULL_35_13]
MKLNAQQLRDLEEQKAVGTIKEVKRNPIYFILENIYDTYNIGGLFRLADAIAVEKIYLCGEMEIPPNHKIKKASIGTYKIVPWEYKRSSKEAIEELRKISNFQFPISNEFSNSKLQMKNNETMKQFNNVNLNIIAVEQNSKSTDYRKTDYRLPLALIFGNESYGITPETLALADQIVEIPMWGINKSLNVIVSAAIVSYWVMNKR